MRIKFGDEHPVTETEAIFANTYIARPRVEIKGEKTWELNGEDGALIPDFIVVKLCGDGILVEEKTVTPDREGKWHYTFSAPKINKGGKEIKYTIQEGPVEASPAGAPLRQFTFLLRAEDGAPLPGGGAGSVKRYFVMGSGMTPLGKFTFTRPGTFVYTIHEVAGGGANWVYDTAQYVLTFEVTAQKGKLETQYELTRDGERADRLVFRNRYDPPASG